MEDWNRIHDQYGSLVWETVYRILMNHTDALDCCQDVFAELVGKRFTQNVRDWPAFLRWVATRRALNRLKQRRIESVRMEQDDTTDGRLSEAQDPASEAEWAELLSHLRLEVSKLPERQAHAFWLNAIEQLSYCEIGDQLGIEANAVGVLIHRARQRLRQTMSVFNPLNQ